MRRSIVVLVACACACTRREPDAIAPSPEGDAKTIAPVGLPEVRAQADVERLDGKRVVVVGRYDVKPVHAHTKGGRMTAIVLDDGTHVSRSYGLVEAELGFADRRVRVTGTITKGPPDPYVQAISGPHVKVESIELEGGGQPPKANGLPTPPAVVDAKGFGAHAGRWIAVTAKVDAIAKGTTSWSEITLRLSDGAKVTIPAGYEPEWTPLRAGTITVIGRAHADPGGALLLYECGRPCAGVAPRCGMD